ncbi:protein-tyrosine phosphatase [Pilibacter termitis]|uniref:Protein-tyrosine phosphatase n=1 Tax=Pilibacter termitis TaxID=263852 RepID=A0A1T4KDV5_9ENTE|nr:tyrosine-protein phosphatase [Pilibacter termitis]SJZ40547.1 protein-tyrosine phosphatase [Pilibacter termitis]
MNYLTRLPLEGTFNTRELGGISVENGYTKWQTFLRSDELSNLTTSDVQYLEKYGIRTIIDLRTLEEMSAEPTPNLENIQIHHVPLFVEDIADMTKDVAKDEKMSLADLYLHFVTKGKNRIYKIIDLISTSKGGLLFHCAAGKDRTGIIAALLLSIAGASRSDIVANYQTTYTYIKENPKFQVNENSHIPVHFLYSQSKSIETLLDFLEKEYGGVKNYLLEIGISDEQMKKIVDNFVCENV